MACRSMACPQARRRRRTEPWHAVIRAVLSNDSEEFLYWGMFILRTDYIEDWLYWWMMRWIGTPGPADYSIARRGSNHSADSHKQPAAIGVFFLRRLAHNLHKCVLWLGCMDGVCAWHACTCACYDWDACPTRRAIGGGWPRPPYLPVSSLSRL